MVVLCGMMGCGKTTVAKLLGERLHWKTVDTDEWIEGNFGSIDRIFEEKGEPYFRGLERLACDMLKGLERETVVSVGGGFVLQKDNADTLSEIGKIVYLRARKETLVERLRGNSKRPLLSGAELSQRVEELLFQRSGVYESVCNFVVDVDEKTPAEIAGEVVEILKKNGAGT